jgi:Fe-S cluster biogenesis protein NfuA
MEKYNNEALYTSQIHIYTEKNPNPNSMKFVLSSILLDEGRSLDFENKEKADISPLAQALFDFEYVDRVFYMNNFITVTKKAEADWEVIIPEIRDFLKAYFSDKKPVFIDNLPDQQIIVDTDSEAVKKIKGTLDEFIKPAVESDGGAIQFHDFDETSGKLTVLLQGSCSGCPSSTITLKAGIENLMKHQVPQVKEVVAKEG